MSPRGPDTIQMGLAAAAERPLAQLASALPRTVGDNPIDPIHDARVALRRLGALLRAFAPVLPPRLVAQTRRDIRWMRRELGPVRDLDVFMHETVIELRELFPSEPGLEGLREAARRRRGPLGEALKAAVTSRRCARLLSSLQRVFGRGEIASPPARRKGRQSARPPRLEAPFAPFARAVLRKRYAKVRKAADGLKKLSTEELHRLRIRLRTFRYLCDGLRAVLPEQRYATLRRTMQDLQDHLGTLNDAVNGPQLVADLARHASRAEDAAKLARAAGLVAGWGAAQRQVLRASLEDPWHRMVKRADRMFAVMKK